MRRCILITGGAGFIGSHVVRLFVNKYPEYDIINLDKLTYAGNLANLKDIEDRPNYSFVKADIADFDTVYALMKERKVDGVIHLAAESHVDRSIKDPFTFARTNVIGTLSLLQAARLYWEECAAEEGAPRRLFYHISTDEVYGSLQMDSPLFKETNKYEPHSPYSASKASSDHFVRSFHDTYGLPTIVTNCSNNYGPYQFPEKLLPLMISNIRDGKNLPVYGKGDNIRDWIYVEDHNRAVWLIVNKGITGEKYNIGGENEWQNIKLLHKVIELTAAATGKSVDEVEKTITYVKDRPGHDKRYAIDCTKIKTKLGWERKMTFEEGLQETVKWYLKNSEWINNILNGNYKQWVEKNYSNR
jgi:dTDP-glucose 4,6-dehydratase